jgi:molybdate transport system substrate-binding protein
MTSIDAMFSLALKQVYEELVPRFERATGHKVNARTVPTVQTVPRLKDGEYTDVVLTSVRTVEELIAAGILSSESRVDVATCGVAVAVRAGGPKPDLSSADALKRAVLNAKSIVYSTGPSGVYVQGLFQRMGISASIESKVKQVQGEPAGALVARGEAELGFQQMCELLPIAGIDVVGPLPPEIQEITLFCGAVHVGSRAPDAARDFLRFFRTADAAEILRQKGLDPVPDTR